MKPILKKSPYKPFLGIKTLIDSADIVIVNLESPITNTGNPDSLKKYVFHIDTSYTKYIKKGGIGGVTIANNHIMDFGITGLKSTLQLLDRYNIKHTGAGMNIFKAREPMHFIINGYRIGVLAYSLTFPSSFWAGKNKAGTAYGNERYIKSDIETYRDSFDFLAVAFHWGEELLDSAKSYQKRIAKLAIDTGADFVYGHHPHTLQGEEIYKKKLVVFSLGNFSFGTYSESGKGEGIMCEIKPDSIIYKIIDLEVRPSKCKFSPYPIGSRIIRIEK